MKWIRSVDTWILFVLILVLAGLVKTSGVLFWILVGVFVVYCALLVVKKRKERIRDRN